MKICLLILMISSVSCSKTSYLVKQGIGQIKIQWNGIENEEVLEDKKVKDDYKQKIKDIQNYKTFFYRYFDHVPTDIYTETSFLKDDAVTYLVIASKYNEVKAIQHSFPFVGKFPYLGFFDKDSAVEFQKELEEKDYVTWMRPVYAYSTLNYFEDKILSSFFHFNKYELAELIFHELTHTVFFIKDDVEFNENLADFVSEKMLVDYFKFSKEKVKSLEKNDQKTKLLMKEVVIKIKKLNIIYKKNNFKDKKKNQKLLTKFLESEFYPHFKKICKENEINELHCFPLSKKGWNNARFTNFLTYGGKKNLIDKLFRAKKLKLKGFLDYLRKTHRKYDDSDTDLSFSNYLSKRL